MDPETSSPESGTAPAPDAPKDEELLAAVNEAIDGETTEAARESHGDDGARTTEEAGEAKGGAEETKGGEPDASGAEKPAAPEKGAEKDKAVAGAEEKSGAAKPDPVNDPIPEEVQGRTRERMQQLIARVKEASAEREKIQRERDDLVGMVAETRATPEQFNQTLEYLRAVNSGDPKQIEAAIGVLQTELAALSRMIGKPVPGVDVLANHADLRQAVDAGDLSEAHARELAAARDARAFASRRYEAMSAEQQQAAAIELGRQGLNDLEKQLQADPEYARKRAILIPALQPVLAQLPPARWVETFKAAYDRLKLGPVAAPAAAAAPAAPTTAAHQPLRARTPAGQAAKAPASLLEAINAGIEQGSRR